MAKLIRSLWPSIARSAPRTTSTPPTTRRGPLPRPPQPPSRRPLPVPPPKPVLPGQPGQPLTLVGSVTLNPGDSSDVNSDALLNPTAFPLEVRELKWVLATPASVAVTKGIFSGFTVDAALRLGPTGPSSDGQERYEALTSAPVPLPLLGRCVDAGAESVRQTGIATAGGVVALDEPLYIPPGQGLLVRLGHRNLFQNTLTANFAASGQLVARVPVRRAVPYWSPFLPAAFAAVGSAATDLTRRSTERDLANLTGGSLRVRRITGRIATYDASVFYTALTDNGDGDFSAKLLQITSMRASNGYAIVKDPLPFGAMFPSGVFSVESPFVMPPKTYINTSLALTPMAGTDVTHQIQPGMCLCGFRDFGGK